MIEIDVMWDLLHYSTFIAAPGQDPLTPAHYCLIYSYTFGNVVYLELEMTTMINLLDSRLAAVRDFRCVGSV